MFGAKNNEHVMFLPNMWNVYSCLHFFQAIELEIKTLFPYYKYIFAQKIVCLHTFTIHVHNTKSKKKQCLNCWLYECTLLDKDSLDLKALVKAMSSKVRWLVDFSYMSTSVFRTLPPTWHLSTLLREQGLPIRNIIPVQ